MALSVTTKKQSDCSSKKRRTNTKSMVYSERSKKILVAAISLLSTILVFIRSTTAFSPQLIPMQPKGYHVKRKGMSGMNLWSENHIRKAERQRKQNLDMVSSSEVDFASNINSKQSEKNEKNNNDEMKNNKDNQNDTINIVLLAGFESFNKELYLNAANNNNNINLQVFADSEIRTGASIGVGGATEEDVTNPIFINAMQNADIFIASLIFDYEDVVAVEALLDYVTGPRLLFECATELMTYNRVGSFSMEVKDGDEDKPMGPPPAVKAILNKFSSGKEEDKISGYLKLLKV